MKTRLAAVLLVLLPAVLTTPAAGDNPTQRASLDSTGKQVSAASGSLDHPPSLSADGRSVVFESAAPALVASDSNGVSDVFRRDLEGGQTVRLSLSSAGEQGNAGSFSPMVSGDGRLVVFESLASNLVAGDTNGLSDIFGFDQTAGTVSAVSASPAGATGNGASSHPSLSRNGQLAAFCSRASDLVPDDTNGTPDVFVRDLTKSETTRVSLSNSGSETSGECWHSALSGDGRFVAFRSAAPDLVDGDSNGAADVFVRDRQTGQTTRVSVSSSGRQADGASGGNGVAISDDGRLVGFDSAATNLVAEDTNGASDVFVHDRQTGETKRASVNSSGGQGGGDSGRSGVAISADGRWVAFESRAPDLVPGDTNGVGDIFVHDMGSGASSLVSIGFDGSPAHDFSYAPAMNGDGGIVAFTSLANNLVVGDRNDQPDVFVRNGSFASSVEVHAVTPTGGAPTEAPGSNRPAPEGGSGLPVVAYVVMAAGAGAMAVAAGRWFLRRRHRTPAG